MSRKKNLIVKGLCPLTNLMTHKVGAEARSKAEVHHGVRGLGLDEASPRLERRGQRPRDN